MTPLRAPQPQGLADGIAHKIRGKRRTCPHRINPGFLARRLDEADAIAGCEYIGIVRDLERRRDGEEATGIAREAGGRKPAGRCSVGCKQHGVGLNDLAVTANDAARFERYHRAMLMQLDGYRRKLSSKCLLHPDIMSCQ